MVEENAVYISYNRCENTIRYSFLSHISAEFNRRGISRVPEKRDADIAKSKVSLVILSEEYAFSKQCLNELLNVRSNNMVVVPVFYRLTKSQLRKQCLKLKNKYDPDDPVGDWRHALLEIADLPGHASSIEQSDSELVEEIVADVRQKLDVTGKKIGIYSRLMKINNLICKQPWGINSLGIWGMGGIGKSTLAEAAFEQLSGDFEAACFIKDFDKAFQEKGAYRLLEEHLGKKLDLNNPFTREKLRDKRIMVVLDDVHKALGATTFLGWFDLLGPRSLIIITSRDKQLLVQCRVKDIYEVQGLDKHESLQMLSGFVTDDNLLDYTDGNPDNLLVYAGGNPLALGIYRRELEDKKPLAMKSEVEKLKRHVSNEIFNTFKKSYDALSDNEKEIFMVIVCFCRGENIEYVMQLLAGCGLFPHVGIDVLVDKSLVFISENRVKMYELIYDFGLKIIHDQTEEVETRYRFLNASNIQSLLEENEIEEDEESKDDEIEEEPKATPKQGNEDIKGLTLDASNLAFKGHAAFEKMYNLRYMKIHCSDHFNTLEEPHSLPPELRFLHWENYPLQSFPKDFNIQHLVELNMPNSNLKKLWEGNQKLDMLKRVTLSQSRELENVDGLQFSQNIEEIYLQECSKLQRFPDMGQSQHLRVLNLSNCKEIKSLPKVPPSIRKLNLQGTKIRELPFFNYSSESLEESTSQVTVTSSNQDLPDIGFFESLEVLVLSDCSMLENIQDLPKNLKDLNLENTAVKELSSSLLESVSKLVILSLKNCKNLQYLPKEISNLKALVTLNLSGCSKLENIHDFPENLKKIYLDGTAIRELPLSIVDLAELATLSLKKCEKLRSLPVGMENMNPLDSLDLSYCSLLKVSDSSLPQAKERFQNILLKGMGMPVPATDNGAGQTQKRLNHRGKEYKWLTRFNGSYNLLDFFRGLKKRIVS